MKSFSQFLKEDYVKEGYTQDAWDKLDGSTKSQYLKDHPDSKYNPEASSTKPEVNTKSDNKSLNFKHGPNYRPNLTDIEEYEKEVKDTISGIEDAKNGIKYYTNLIPELERQLEREQRYLKDAKEDGNEKDVKQCEKDVKSKISEIDNAKSRIASYHNSIPELEKQLIRAKKYLKDAKVNAEK